MRSHSVVMLVLAFGLCTACEEELPPPPPAKPTVPRPPGSKVVKTPVAYGKKVPCTTLLPADKVSAAFGKQVTVVDRSQTEDDASSICQIKLAGTPPSAKAQQRMWIKNNRVLGVLPGDEICQVTAYCSFIYELPEQKKKCESDGQLVSTEIGTLTCVKPIQAGSEYRYVVSALDPDSRCRIVVNPGPSVIDEATVKQCAKAAVDLIGPESLKVP